MHQQLYQSLPSKPGVYTFKNDKGAIIYVGKAKDLKKRVSSYFLNKSNLESRTLSLIAEVKTIDHTVVGSEIEAFLLEAELIKKHKPFYNIKLTDDKSFPYLKISSDRIPYLSISRKKEDVKADYFGPYTDVTGLKIVLKIIRRIFPYQSVRNHPKKACLYNHIGLCPCVTAFPHKLYDYKRDLKNLKKFLKGQKDEVIKSLQKQQKENIKYEEFEKAAQIQKQIEKINLITSENYSPFRYQEVPDLYFQRIQNEVESLKGILNKYGLTPNNLKRIECYDISNISGKDATGSMVVFTNGEASKQNYRRFKIRFKRTPDDFLMHKEMMSRRVRHDEWEKPDLIVIDGGKGQVSSVLQVIKQNNFDVPLIGLAKREEAIVIPEFSGSKLIFIEVKLPHSTPGVNLLRRLRDEAHRFAITYHRNLRRKRYLGKNV